MASIYQISTHEFARFNCAPNLYRVKIEHNLDDSLRIAGHVHDYNHEWYAVGLRGPEVAAESFGFLVDVVTSTNFGSYTIGLRGDSSIYISHFIRSSLTLNYVQPQENAFSGWSYDMRGERKQDGFRAPWSPLVRQQYHTLGVFFDPSARRMYATADGAVVHERHDISANKFYPVIRVSLNGFEADIDFTFTNIRVLVGSQTSEAIQRLRGWATEFAPVFVSYSHEDNARVAELVVELRKKSVRVRGDWDFASGDSLLRRISGAIDSSGCLLACLSPTSVQSAWVQRELEIALAPDIAGKLNVVPVLLADCEIPLFLRSRLYHDVRPPNPLVSEQFLASLRANAW
jgi:hypothetical protein